MASKNSSKRVKVKPEALWERLDQIHMTQNALAARLGITSGHLSRLVRGLRSPSPELRLRLQEALGCHEFEELFFMAGPGE